MLLFTVSQFTLNYFFIFRYISFTICGEAFLDFCQFMMSSLEMLTKSHLHDNFEYLSKYLELFYGGGGRHKAMINDLATNDLESAQDTL